MEKYIYFIFNYIYFFHLFCNKHLSSLCHSYSFNDIICHLTSFIYFFPPFFCSKRNQREREKGKRERGGGKRGEGDLGEYQTTKLSKNN